MTSSFFRGSSHAAGNSGGDGSLFAFGCPTDRGDGLLSLTLGEALQFAADVLYNIFNSQKLYTVLKDKVSSQVVKRPRWISRLPAKSSTAVLPQESSSTSSTSPLGSTW
jgi:hypothetical protein